MAVVLIALRNLLGEKGRFMMTVGGVAFSVLLILVLVGLYQGWTTQMTRFLGSLPADLWIGQQGTRDMSHSVSLLPRGLKERIESAEGIKKVVAFVGRQVGFDLNGKESHLFLIGMDDEGIIAPYLIREGKKRPDDGEIIVDITYARQEKLSVGDVLPIAGKELRISGISSGGNLLVYSYAFAKEDEVREILGFDAFSNYYLVQSDDLDAAHTALAASFSDLAVIDRQTFLETNANLVRETFLPIIGVLVLIAIGIGIAVIGLTIFTATIEKSQEYGVLKALGYSDRELFFVVALQSFFAGLIGFAVGSLFALALMPLAEARVSGFLYEVNMREIGFVLLTTFTISGIASFLPIRRIVSIDPVRVFKA